MQLGNTECVSIQPLCDLDLVRKASIEFVQDGRVQSWEYPSETATRCGKRILLEWPAHDKRGFHAGRVTVNCRLWLYDTADQPTTPSTYFDLEG